MTSSPLVIGMTLAPTWLNGNGWRRADSGIEGLMTLDYYTSLARRAEAAGMDFLFRPDTLFMPGQGNGPGGPAGGLDPTLLMAALIGATSRVGLLTTLSATFLPPWYVARQLMSLHWLSEGRIGWNIVTALDGHRNFGHDAMPDTATRYQKADEFHDLVQALWASFPAGAVRNDRATGRALNAELIRPVNHEGAHFSVAGPLSIPARPGPRIPVFQAGASELGRQFAARVADAVFAATPDIAAAIEQRSDLIARARALGRGRAPLFVPGLSLFLADSRAEAQDLYAETHRGADEGRRLARLKLLTGKDFTDWPRDRPVTPADLPPLPETLHSQTSAKLLHRMIARDTPTLEALFMAPELIGSPHWQVIGTETDAIDAIRDWQRAGAMDGFIAFPGGAPACIDRVLGRLMPELVDAGLRAPEPAGADFMARLGLGA